MVRGLVVRLLAGLAVVLGLSAAAALVTFVRWRSEPRDALTLAVIGETEEAPGRGGAEPRPQPSARPFQEARR
jgi:hypothetical protein